MLKHIMLIQLTYASRTFKTLVPKYSRSASFNPYTISPNTLNAFFDEIKKNAAWIG